MSFIPKTHLQKNFGLLICFTMLIFLVCVFFCYLNEHVIAEGIIRPLQTETNVKAQFSGTVTEVFYNNSQFVNKDDILFMQDCTYEKESLQNLINLQSLYEKNANSYKNLQKLLDSTNLECCYFDEDFAKEDSLYSSFVNQYQRYKNETEAKKKYFERQLAVYPGNISKQELENSENSFLQSKLNFSSWIENQKIENLEQYSQCSQKCEECRLQIFQVQKKIENATVKAKQSGFVNEITKISKGEYINAETQILTLIPEKPELKCVINVSNSGISKIKIGQDVFFQIKDLPFTKYGKLQGKICMIPSDAVMAEAPFYPVEVLLSKNYMKAKNQFGKTEVVMLKIGTKVNAKVIVDKNTIFQKLLQKIMVYDE